MSKYEKVFEQILKELGLKYVYQKKVDKYAFDFYIVDYNMLVEIDGEQHYDARRFKDREKALQRFLRQKELDAKKDDIALKQGYNLIRIPYTMFKNKENLKRELKLILEKLMEV